MAHSDDLVVALARTYGLSDLLDADDQRLLRWMEEIREGLAGSGAVEIEVDADALRVDGRPVEDPHGFVGEMARDLGHAGVKRVRLSDEAVEGGLLGFVQGLREGAGRGDPEGTRAAFEDSLDGVSVSFEEAAGKADAAVGELESLFGAGSAEEGEEAGEEAPAAAGAPGEGAASAVKEPAADERPREGTVEVDPGREEAGPEPASPEEDLSELTGAFLEGGPDDREAVAGRISERAAGARQEGTSEEVAAAAVRLVTAAHEGTGDPEALELAREIVNIGVAARLAMRLGGIREEEERQRMIRVAGDLGAPMAEAVAEALADTSDRSARRNFIDTLVALGEPGIREAERMIDDGRWFVVRNGVSILGEVGGDRAIEHLTSALGHDDARVRREAVMALARIGGEDAGDLLVGMVDDPDPDVRAAVAMALGVLKVERAVKPLLQRLDREDETDVKVQIIRALGALGDPGAVSAIEKRAVASFFSRPPTPLRIAAYKALSDIGTPHAMKLLEQAADDKDDQVRETAQSLLAAREG